jgi:hypothetical protein
MDDSRLARLEQAANIIFAICESHPEICPHDYRWVGISDKDDVTVKTYRCSLCNNEIEVETS